MSASFLYEIEIALPFYGDYPKLVIGEFQNARKPIFEEPDLGAPKAATMEDNVTKDHAPVWVDN